MEGKWLPEPKEAAVGCWGLWEGAAVDASGPECRGVSSETDADTARRWAEWRVEAMRGRTSVEGGQTSDRLCQYEVQKGPITY